MVDDQVLTPTYTADLAQATRDLILDRNATGFITSAPKANARGTSSPATSSSALALTRNCRQLSPTEFAEPSEAPVEFSALQGQTAFGGSVHSFLEGCPA